jgi:hypothetical protein
MGSGTQDFKILANHKFFVIFKRNHITPSVQGRNVPPNQSMCITTYIYG